MNVWEMRTLRQGPRWREPRRIEVWARRAVVGALGRLRTGRVILHEGASTLELGAGDAGSEIEVFDPQFYVLAARSGAIGAAEAYRKGFWEADDLTSLFRIFVRRIGHESAWERRLAWIGSLPGYVRHALRRNGRLDSRRNIERHYDLGNDFFECFLDSTLTYSCGVFESPVSSMREASEAKLRRMARILDLRPGMRVLEIGSGWGSFAIQTAKDHDVRVTSVTLSKEQHREAVRRVRAAGLENKVEIRLQDYRDVSERFDRVASIEMIEAIGHHRLGEFFATVDRLLDPDGALALQAITMPDQGYRDYLRRTDVIRHFIFPGSCCPARSALIEAATRNSTLRTVHLEEIGPHYATTLRHWREAFVDRLEDIQSRGYPAEFLRLWHFYLCYCEAGFAERHVGNVQMMFAKPGFRGRLPSDPAREGEFPKEERLAVSA